MKKILIVLMALVFSACAQLHKRPAFTNVKLDMTKEAVIQAVGAPDNVIATHQVDGNLIEVLEYRDNGLWWGDRDEQYWFFFNNNKLQKWGRPGDHLRYLE
jgi:hypothetical protein